MELRRLLLALAVAGAALLSESCMKQTAPPVPQPRTVKSKDELVLYLDTLELRYEAACKVMGVANWNSYSKEAPYNLDSAKAGFAKIFLDTTARGIITEWRRKSSSLADKPLARRLELWYRCFIGGAVYADPDIAALENALQKKITDFPFTYDGAPVTRAEASTKLRQEKKQPVRHALWSVTGQLSAKTAADLAKLVKLRNARAAQFGFSNYYSLSLYLHSINEEWLLKTLGALADQTEEPFREFIAGSAKKIRVKKFGAWDFDYALREAVSLPNKYFPEDSVFSVIHAFQKGIGFPVDSLPIKEVVKDIPYGGLSLAIVIPTDSRFLVNPTKGKGFYAVAFHEYGHSLKAVHTNVEYPILKGYEWIPGAQCAAYEEGVADMHGEFTDDSLWLSTFTKAKPKEIDRYIEGRGIPALFRLRRLLKDFFVEYEMYKNPDQDLAAVERAMFKKYLLVDVDSLEQHQYAASIWYTAYPCYYQNYILAGMIATQLQEALTSKFGEEKSLCPELAAWMISHLYQTGESTEWTERIRNATGKSLETGPYLRKLGIEQAKILTKEE
jgi:peptidyl-dipeptidase A